MIALWGYTVEGASDGEALDKLAGVRFHFTNSKGSGRT